MFVEKIPDLVFPNGCVFQYIMKQRCCQNRQAICMPAADLHDPDLVDALHAHLNFAHRGCPHRGQPFGQLRREHVVGVEEGDVEPVARVGPPARVKI